ncbi:uncharacterized protein C8A04DRAFT_33919 [Dichotomopilus funicola]|uniref:Tyrosine--tRNA ligase n=1 Tax=Dichotomopilus funicola TaxID=1934379 RepID=A0AAN6VBD4_9PEZI|nr:hypothetical protein C8A04DRAFT_33919 [Dichotomopilus funicola]
MASPMAVLSRRGTVCRGCLPTLARGAAPGQRRSVSMKFLQKTADAEAAWEENSMLIRAGEKPHLFDILEERGFVHQTAGSPELIRKIMLKHRVSAYVGIDPSAASLHIGHLLPLMPIFWMYMHGYGAHTLIGGSTVKIGDPTDRLKDREAIKGEVLAINLTKIHFQLKKLWDNVEIMARRFGYQKEWAWRRGLINNNVWWNSTPFLEVLRRVGKSTRVGPMLSRETVRRKMEEGDGMSFAEFAYPIMQGWDWWMLYNRLKVQMQIGGSDQYGNIIAGIDIFNTARDNEPDPSKAETLTLKNTPIGFTVPLLTDSSGVKFGKTAGNAVWLDQYMTYTHDLYGYLVRRPDSEVERLLKLFTFLPLPDIEEIMVQQREDPSKRVAQHRLASEVVSLVHGSAAAQEAEQRNRMMSGQGGVTIAMENKEPDSEYDMPPHQTTLNTAPRIDMTLPKSLILGKSIGRIMYGAKLASSIKEGHRLATQQAAYIAGMPGRPVGLGQPMDPAQLTWTPIKIWLPEETQKYLIGGKILILRRGKHNVRIIKVVSDEEYKASGKTYPGQPYAGRLRRLRETLKLMKDGEITIEDARQVVDHIMPIQSRPGLNFPAMGRGAGELTALQTQIEAFLEQAQTEENNDEEDNEEDWDTPSRRLSDKSTSGWR